MSWTLNRQQQFRDQPKDQLCVWVYGLFPDKPGNYIKKPMAECTGEEICEWLYHVGVPTDKIEALAKSHANTVPVMMPYITAFFMPRSAGDRPDVVPDGAVNFARSSASSPRRRATRSSLPNTRCAPAWRPCTRSATWTAACQRCVIRLRRPLPPRRHDQAPGRQGQKITEMKLPLVQRKDDGTREGKRDRRQEAPRGVRPHLGIVPSYVVGTPPRSSTGSLSWRCVAHPLPGCGSLGLAHDLLGVARQRVAAPRLGDAWRPHTREEDLPRSSWASTPTPDSSWRSTTTPPSGLRSGLPRSLICNDVATGRGCMPACRTAESLGRSSSTTGRMPSPTYASGRGRRLALGRAVRRGASHRIRRQRARNGSFCIEGLSRSAATSALTPTQTTTSCGASSRSSFMR